MFDVSITLDEFFFLISILSTIFEATRYCVLHSKMKIGTKKKTLILFLFFIAAACFQSSCTIDRLLGWNDGIGRVDTIVIIPTITNLFPIAHDMEIVNDTLLPQQISDSIMNISAQLLRKKYVMLKTPGKTRLNQAQKSSLIGAIHLSEDKETELRSIKLESNIYEQFNPKKNRHILITYIEGKYKTKKQIKSSTNVGLPANAVVAVALFATFGMVAFLMPKYSTTVMKTILYDTKDDCIAYYHTSRISQDNLWDNETIKNFVYSGCKKLYYRKNR